MFVVVKTFIFLPSITCGKSLSLVSLRKDFDLFSHHWKITEPTHFSAVHGSLK